MIEQPQAGVAVYRSLPQARVTHGAGSARDLLGALARAGAQRALVICGPAVAELTGLLAYVEQCLGPWHAGSYIDARSLPTAASIDDAVELFRAAEADALVSLGGGAAIDTTKAVAHALLEEHGVAPPHVAVPTTLSGAAFTHQALLTEIDGSIRRVVHAALVPREVVLDPVLTIETPPVVWLSSGIAALGHAIELSLSPLHRPITDALAPAAGAALFDALSGCAADPDASEPRARAQVAAWMSYFGAASTPITFGEVLGLRLATATVPFGVGACVTLAPLLRLMRPATAERQDAIAGRLGLGESLDETVARLVRELALPARLRDTTLRPDALSELAERAWGDARDVSPRTVTDASALRACLEAAW